ncbi:MAG: hypothetical protein IJ569_03830 [Prevotella sp.]|nr:hypothetical protein [Prevotella sp.]
MRNTVIETERTCRECGRTLPINQFERYSTGVYRRVCRHCHWELHGKKALKKYRMKQLAALIMKR